MHTEVVSIAGTVQKFDILQEHVVRVVDQHRDSCFCFLLVEVWLYVLVLDFDILPGYGISFKK